MSKYESLENLYSRAVDLYWYGHTSSVWGFMKPPERGHVIEIVDPYYVSRPCWKEVVEAADYVDTVTLNLGEILSWVQEGVQEDIYQLFFSDGDVARKMALRVRQSARNIRKDDMRRIRLDKAGGFHDKQVLDQLFEIQEGRCYYSGDLLTRKPKNFVIDHIRSIYLGGSNWPANLALVIKEINTWKGGHASSKDTLLWIAKERGKTWLRNQKAYCLEVDSKREKLDQTFRSRVEHAP